MACRYFGECGGCQFGEDYNLDFKVETYRKILPNIAFSVFTSPLQNFRARCEIGVFHQDGKIHFVMRGKKSQKNKNSFVFIEQCLILQKPLQELLEVLKVKLNAASIQLTHKLFSLEILSSIGQQGAFEALLTLIYHKPLEAQWEEEAKLLQENLTKTLGFEVKIIGRAKKTKIVLKEDFLIASLKIQDKTFFYRYDEGAFVQPNPLMNQKMIEWVLEALPKSHKDLLEMYCGCGNFTIPLAAKFNQVLATEISKTSLKALQFALKANKVSNITTIRLSGEECQEALERVREFYRLRNIDLDSFDFECVLIDPPRAGLGQKIAKFLQRFPKIIYISCNPLSLSEDLKILLQTHQPQKLAFFDQFPYTSHLECGIILSSNNP